MSDIRYISFSTGSCGNCAYLGTGEAGILIDAGISLRRVQRCMSEAGIDIGSIKAVLITHDHADHVSSAGRISQKTGCQIWSLRETMDGIMGNPYVKVKPDTARYMEVLPGTTYRIPGTGFSVEPFPVPHDAHGNAGYFITAPGFSFCLVTDCGTMTDLIMGYLMRAENVVLESDYDAGMLAASHYPQFLQKRISGPMGHMGNGQCAEVLKCIARNGVARRVFLCHISGETNTPERSYSTAASALQECGSCIDPVVLPRGCRSEEFILSK